MKKKLMAALMAILISGCASSAKKPEIPSKMLPQGGKTQSRAKGLGDAAPFVK